MAPAPAVIFSQLLPAVRRASAEELLGELDLRGRAGADRPYTVVNFIASADGRSSFQGRSGALGDEGDRAMFHALREQADAVMAGTTTLSAESYGRIIGKPERRERRLARGLPGEPLACVVSRSGRVPLELPLFAEPEARIVVFTSREPKGIGDCAAAIELRLLDPQQLNLTHVLSVLRQELDIRLLLCEGGPTMFGSLLAEGLLDELFLTLAPRLVGGGTASSLIAGAEPAALTRLQVGWLLERAGSLFLRYEAGQTEPSERV